MIEQSVEHGRQPFALRQHLLRLYSRLELPGWRRLLLPTILRDRPQGYVESKLRPHGYRLRLNLGEPWEAWSYFAGRYYELHTELLLSRLLMPGDGLVDVGANIGYISLTGAWKVGPGGFVIALEPNPAVYERLKHHVSINGLNGAVTTYNLALGDEAGALDLTVPVEGTGGATLGKLGAEYSGRVAQRYTVRVETGDSVLAPMNTPLVIKIDVEGFETAVIRGLQRTIRRSRPAMIVEAWPEHLRNAGSSIQELFALAEELGYEVFNVHAPLRIRGMTQTARIVLQRITNSRDALTDDVLWLHPDSVHRERMAAYLHA